MHWVAIAFSPAIALIWFLYARNAYTPARKSLVTLLFLSGFLSAGMALGLNHMVEKYTLLWPGARELHQRLLFWVLGVGLNEEFAKMVPLLVFLYPRRDFQTPYQGLLGAAAVALGFAALENVLYMERFGAVTLLVRSILTVPAHAFFSVPMGVMMAYSKHAEGEVRRYLWLLGGLAVATGFHGLYDVWLSLGVSWVEWFAYLQVALMGVLALRLMRLGPLGQANQPQTLQPPQPLSRPGGAA